jgi:uncharacterized protein involved in exopolysaccharide biosynthesis
VGFAIGVYIALTATWIFRAETVITPARSSGVNASGSGGNLSGLAGIASLAGINLDSGNGTDRESKAILQSRNLVEEFIQNRNLLGVLFPRPKKPPSLWLGVKTFREGVMSIREDKRAGLITIAVEWKDPAVAADWANGFVALANDRMRTRAISEATNNIAFLNKQIAQTSVVDLQKTFYGLIENETKSLMLANARAEYAFTVVDPAVPPERRVSPRRTLVAGVGLLAGLTIGLLIAFARSALIKFRRSVKD